MEKVLEFLATNQDIAIITGVCICFIVLYFVLKKDEVKQKSSMLMPGYRVFYTDQKEEHKLPNVIYSKILYSEKYDIQGKPDYIFKSVIGNRLVPVEIKSGYIGKRDMAYEGDLMQLAAYFIIIKDVYGVTPKYGKIVYKDYMFIVKNNRKIRDELIKKLYTMGQMLEGKNVKINPTFVKCRHCVCNGTVCKFCGKNEKG